MEYKIKSFSITPSSSDIGVLVARLNIGTPEHSNIGTVVS